MTDFCFTVYLAHREEPVIFNTRGFANDILEEIMAGGTIYEIADYDGYAVAHFFNPAHVLHVEYFKIDDVMPHSWDDIYK